MKVGMEILYAIQYKLRIMDIPIPGVSYIYGDNMSVIHNTSKPELTLKKKHNEIAHHVVCKSLVMGKSLAWHIKSEDNQADISAKAVTGQKRKHLLSLVFYDIFYGDTNNG